MPHTILSVADGYRIRFTGRLTSEEATSTVAELIERGACGDHRYEVLDLTEAEPLTLSHEELHDIARRSRRPLGSPTIRLAIVGSSDVLGTNGADYAHILGSWVSDAWDVRTFNELADGEAWAMAATSESA
jgi:hypothetical protein